MDPNSSSTTDSNSDSTPSSGQPGQVVGPGGAAMPPAAPVPPPPSATPPVTISPAAEPPSPSSPEPPRPTAVGESPLPASSVVLPPQPGTYGAMSYNTAGQAKAKTSFMKKFAGKRLLIFAAVPLILLSASAAAYFGYVVPNQPDNVWAKALTNTGKAYDKLADYTQTQINSTSKGVNVDASFKTTGEFISDGTFKGSSYGDDSEFTGNLSTNGIKANLDLRTLKSTGDTPDIYFKVDGLQDVGSLLGGDPSLQNSINSVNGSWYSIDHTLLEQYAKDAGTSSPSSFKSSDVKSVLDAVGAASKQNVFTANPAKMAFVVKQKIGKEKIDERNTYHFKVGINPNNLKAYEDALCSNLKDSSLKKFFNNSTADTSSALDCSDNKVNSTKDTADVWVDLHTKLIHKIRFTDSTNSQDYFDVGQDYQGGDEIPFSLSVHDKEGNNLITASLSMTLNMKTNKFTMSGSAQDTGDSPIGGSFSLTISPNNSKLNIEKPDNAKNVAQLVNDLGLNDLFGGDSSGNSSATNSADAERDTDINSMHGQIEAYWATNGYYPSLAQMNDAGWRASNMPDLDSESLKDPGGNSSTLVSKPAANAYSYETTPANCTSQCAAYTLTATFRDGTTYVKQSLNDPASSAVLN